MPKVEERAPEPEPEQDQKPRARAPVPRLSVGTDLVDEHEGAGGD